ncbi:hypothetical protein V3C99_013867 [Haemonchus contortus]|uniref:Uncharacterized protein n=1 Tax=Haemonchus contortus TaxID=6289 RepID=A0A6F7Q019_HAECO
MLAPRTHYPPIVRKSGDSWPHRAGPFDRAFSKLNPPDSLLSRIAFLVADIYTPNYIEGSPCASPSLLPAAMVESCSTVREPGPEVCRINENNLPTEGKNQEANLNTKNTQESPP